MIAKKEEDVRDCSQRIVDFVCNDSRDASHRGQFFGFPQCFFGLHLRGDISIHLENCIAFVVHGFSAGNNDFGTVFSRLNKVPLPELAFQQGVSTASRETGKTVFKTVCRSLPSTSSRFQP